MRPSSKSHILAVAARTLAAGALSLCAIPALAQTTPERLMDKDVKALIEQVDSSRDKFQGNLDGKLKNSLLRTATGEVQVSGVLKDFQDNVDKLKERFSSDYAASTEVSTLLKQATGIDTWMKSNPAVTKGRSEWDRAAAGLGNLAAAYGATFPMPEGAAVRRMNDKETSGAAAGIAIAVDRFKSDVDKVPVGSLPKADKDANKKELELLKKQADSVKSRISDGKPATAEVRQLIAQILKVQKFVDGHQVPLENWKALQDSLGKLQQAFGLIN